MTAFWSLVLLLFYGCHSLHNELVGRVDALKAPLGGLRIPIVGIELTPAFLIVAPLFCLGTFFTYRWLEKPKSADLLIETESELRKVTWPSTPEVVNSSLVVVFSVLFLMGFLAVTDWFFGRLTHALLGI